MQLRRVVNQTKGGKKRSMRALVVIGNKDGAAGMYVRDEDSLVSLSALLPLPLPLPLAVSALVSYPAYFLKWLRQSEDDLGTVSIFWRSVIRMTCYNHMISVPHVNVVCSCGT